MISIKRFHHRKPTKRIAKSICRTNYIARPLAGVQEELSMLSRPEKSLQVNDLDPVYDLMVAGGTGSSSSSTDTTGVGAKLGLEYYFYKLSFMAYYEFPFLSDYLYVVNDSELMFSHFGLSVYYNIIK
jgi:hypothetical protein